MTKKRNKLEHLPLRSQLQRQMDAQGKRKTMQLELSRAQIERLQDALDHERAWERHMATFNAAVEAFLAARKMPNGGRAPASDQWEAFGRAMLKLDPEREHELLVNLYDHDAVLQFYLGRCGTTARERSEAVVATAQRFGIKSPESCRKLLRDIRKELREAPERWAAWRGTSSADFKLPGRISTPVPTPPAPPAPEPPPKDMLELSERYWATKRDSEP